MALEHAGSAMRNALRPVTIALVSALLMAACAAPPGAAAPAVSAAPTTVASAAASAKPPLATVALRGGTSLTASSVAFAPYLTIGKELGWLKDEALDVKIDNLDTAVALTLVTRGEIDFFIGAPESLLTVEAKGTKTGVKFAYKYYTRPWYWLAVLPDSPVKTADQLKGKTVGLSSLGVPQSPALESYLRESGLKPTDVTTVVVGNSVAAATALKDGKIDAMLQIANSFVTFENAGFQYRYLAKPKGLDDLFGASFYVHENVLTNPAKLEGLGRYFRVVAKSVLFAKTNPEATVRIHWKVAPESKPTGLAEAKALADGTRQIQVGMDHAGREGRWGEFTSKGMKAYIDFLGLSAALPNPDALYTTAFVKAANEWSEPEVVALAKSYKIQ